MSASGPSGPLVFSFQPTGKVENMKTAVLYLYSDSKNICSVRLNEHPCAHISFFVDLPPYDV